jgi:hypothetical protein
VPAARSSIKRGGTGSALQSPGAAAEWLCCLSVSVLGRQAGEPAPIGANGPNRQQAIRAGIESCADPASRSPAMVAVV